MAVEAQTREVEARGREETFLQRLSRLAAAMTPLNGVRVEVRRRLGVLNDHAAEREAPDHEKVARFHDGALIHEGRFAGRCSEREEEAMNGEPAMRVLEAEMVNESRQERRLGQGGTPQ